MRGFALSPRRRARSSSRPQVEPMEPRRLLATITVTGTGDTIAVDQIVTLREAITAANTNAASGDAAAGTPGLDTIAFNIPGAGVQTIALLTALPAITEAVEINGYTQSDASPNTNGPGLGDNAVLRIQLVPTQPGLISNGLLITSGGSTVRGLVINTFANGINLQTNGGNTVAGNFIGTTPDGLTRASPFSLRNAVLLQSSNNTIGGTAPADRNLLTGTTAAVAVPSNSVADALNNVIQGNFLNTDATGRNGTGGGNGIFIGSGSGDQIGGAGPGAGNLISGDTGIRIDLGGPTPSSRSNSNGGHVIQGNLIGTDLTGAALLNITSGGQPAQGIAGSGISIAGLDHFDPTVNPLPITIGGTSAGAGNTLAGSQSTGISLRYPSGFTAATSIQGNSIGTDRTGVLNLGNRFGGIDLDTSGFSTARNITVTGNTIAFNGERFNSAISIPSGETGILIVDNSIHDNGDGNPGIIPEPGGNGPPPPVLTSVSVAGSTTTVQGTVSGAAGSTIRVDVYANAPPPPPITVQGQTPVRTLQVTVGANGTGAFTASFPTVPSQPLITATATTPSNTTGPFSAPAQPPAGPVADLVVTTTAVPNPVTVGGTLTYTVTVSNAGPDAGTGVTLTDTLPAGVTFVSATGGVTPVSNTLTFNLGSLPNGAGATVTVVVRPNAAGAISSSASAASAVADPNAANNTDEETTTVSAAPVTSADLAVTLADSPDPAVAGTNVTYTLVVTNAGPDAAGGVSLTTAVPAGTTFVSFAAPAGWTATTPATGQSGTITATTAALGAGGAGPATFALVVRIRTDVAGGSSIDGSAQVAAATGDPTTANNSATAVTTVASAPPPPPLPQNKAPTATADAYTTTAGVALSIRGPGVLRNDTDPENNTLRAVMVTSPSHGALALKADGSFRYTPAAGFSGKDRFSYRASDGSHRSAPVVVTLIVATARPTVDATGPRLTGLQRFGFHAQPTVLVLTLDRSLDPARASDPANYRIVTIGGPGRGGSQPGRVIPVASVAYLAGSRTLQLFPAQRLDVHNVYRLVVNGRRPGGVVDAAGRLLDGRGVGVPGSDFAADITRATLVGPASAATFGAPATSVQLRSAAPSGRRPRGVGPVESTRLRRGGSVV